MASHKPCSTISYNSEEFLKMKLTELYDNHIISDWMYIIHDPEEDELKRHAHVYIEPNKMIDRMNLRDVFREFDPTHPETPLGCIKVVNSDIDEWILYNLHDSDYLRLKGETRKYHYFKNDIVFADEETYNESYRHAYHSSKFAEQMQKLQAIRENIYTPANLIMQGRIPVALAGSLKALQSMLKDEVTYRNGRPNHEADYAELIDIETGEIYTKEKENEENEIK